MAGLLFWLVPSSAQTALLISLAGFALAPLPALLITRRSEARLRLQARKAEEEIEELKVHLRAIRYRAGRLREELSAADRDALLSRQLTLLGRFTAGFLHEFNNPLAILTSRIEVLLEERKEDGALCADLEQMLKEARYMGNIAGTLLRALRRERREESFEPCLPAEALQEVAASLGPSAERQGVRLLLEPAETPRVSLPLHVVMEVTRALVSNALEALGSRDRAAIRLRLEAHRTPGARVILRVEDNGPGVPDEVREHLFEPFVSRSMGAERVGLGLFLAASLMDAYGGSLRYEPGAGGGASFLVEMPPARFAKAQPSEWFVRGVSP